MKFTKLKAYIMNTNLSNNINFTGLPKFQIKVDDRLIRGRAVTCPYRLYKMKQEGITQVIDLRNSSYLERPLERLFCKLLGIKYKNEKYPHRLNILPEHNFFENINQAILKNDGKTYIHCQYGKRRTGICTAIYEKYHTTKSKDEIISNMLNLGYKELLVDKVTYKTKKLQSIFDDFLKKYYPESKKP